ncbi:MAG: putative sulfate exporter family transporter [Bacteroidota bacterium]|nr:putative sulfate exporter family transporter [Bacteroidota bacterium]
MMNKKAQIIIFVLLLIACAFPVVSAPLALFAGIVLAVTIGNPVIEKTQKLTHKLLQFSVIGLGFGMNAAVALEAGKKGFIYTIAGITLTFLLGFIISRFLKVNKNTSILISAGTAICGGSAIAAVAPVIEAKSEDTTVALGVVFILNSVALLLFPFIGHYLGLSQPQFGLWSAIAIHDTSSVVGASSQYGKLALATATTIKLTRALWIIPVTLLSALMFKSDLKKIKIPFFIFAFFLAMLVNTYFTSMHNLFQIVYLVAKQALVVTLFLIGSNLSKETLKKVGLRPFVMGITLWVIISSLSLLAV